jgi:membrane protease YdiL (CAAX protease family)
VEDFVNSNSKKVSYTAGFFMLIGIALLGLVISGVIGGVILIFNSGGNAAGLESALSNPKNAATLRMIQTISVIIGMFLPACFVASILNRRPFSLLGFRKQIQLKQVGLIVLIVFASLFIAGTLGYLTKLIPFPATWKSSFDKMESSYGEQVEIMVSLKSFSGYIMSVALMAFLPAVCEETLFRGGLQNFLGRATKSPWLAIIIVSILFSAVHFSAYGFLPRMFLGIVLGCVYYFTGNLWLSILLHFLNNALAVTQAYALAQQGKGLKEAMNDDISPYYWGIIALPVLFFLFRALKNISQKEQLQTSSPSL